MPPAHILNAPTKLMKNLGYGAGYDYDHGTEEAFSGQNYFPDGMNRERFYQPKDRGLSARSAAGWNTGTNCATKGPTADARSCLRRGRHSSQRRRVRESARARRGSRRLVDRPATVGFGKNYPEFWLNARPGLKPLPPTPASISVSVPPTRTRSTHSTPRRCKAGWTDAGAPGASTGRDDALLRGLRPGSGRQQARGGGLSPQGLT